MNGHIVATNVRFQHIMKDVLKEIVPVTIPQRKGDPIVVAKDEAPRADTTIEKLAKLKPVFDKTATVTAGNAPGLNDGGAALVLMSEDRAEARRKKAVSDNFGTYSNCSGV